MNKIIKRVININHKYKHLSFIIISCNMKRKVSNFHLLMFIKYKSIIKIKIIKSTNIDFVILRI